MSNSFMTRSRARNRHSTDFAPQESAGKTLEEIEFLFMKTRSPWVFRDKEATKVGALFDRDMANGEALGFGSLEEQLSRPYTGKENI